MHRVEGQPLSTIFREAIHIYQRLELEESRLGRPTPDTRRVQFSESRNIRPREPDTDSLSHRCRNDPLGGRPLRAMNVHRVTNTLLVHVTNHRDLRVTNHCDPRAISPRATQRTQSSPTDRFCHYCKAAGHDIYECRKREFNNSLRSGNGPTLPSRNGPRREEQSQRVETVTQVNELRVASLRPTENNSIPRVKFN